MGIKEKEILLNSLVYSNFNYCLLVWHFCSAKSVKKIEKIQERALRILYNNFSSDLESILNKSGKSTVEVKRLRTLALEVPKTLNNMNLQYMTEIFHKTAFTTHRPLNLGVNENHTTKYRNKGLICLGAHIWNSLPNQIKEETDYAKFKEFTDDWFDMKCKCNLCSFLVQAHECQFYIVNTTSDLTRFIVGNGFHYFLFLFNFIIFVCCKMYMYIFLKTF